MLGYKGCLIVITSRPDFNTMYTHAQASMINNILFKDISLY